MIAGKTINLEALYNLLFEHEELELSEECMQSVEESFRFLQAFAGDKIIYGINTGFGPMAQYRIEDKSLTELQYNIIRSHSTGAGQPLPEIYVLSVHVCRTQHRHQPHPKAGRLTANTRHYQNRFVTAQ